MSTVPPGFEDDTIPQLSVRPFPLLDVQKQIDDLLATIPEDKHGAILAVADQDRARAALMVKIPISGIMAWSFGGYVEKDWHGPISTGVETKFTF